MTRALLTVIPPLPLDAHWRRPVDPLPFPLDHGPVRLFARARQGLYQGLVRLGLRAGHVALVPAYHHGSEIEAYVRAGLTLRYYEAHDDLAPDRAELERSMDGDVRVLHLIHYLGVAQDVAAWRSWCDARGVLLVEDDAQGWLGAAQGKPLGTTGDIALFSLYKSVGVPDGGAVVVRGEPIGPARVGETGTSAALVKHGAWLASRWGPLGSLWASRRRTRAYDAEKDFALGDPESPAVAVTGNLAVRLAVPAVAETRRRHYRRLLEALQRWVPEPFVRDLGAASPFAFPVQVTDKQRAISIMAEHGVVAVDAWSVPHPSLPAGSFPMAARRRASVVLLPVHQELRDRDLDRIIVAARSALGASK